MTEKRAITQSTTHSTGVFRSSGFGHSIYECESWSVSPDCEIDYRLHRLAKKIGLTRQDGEDNDALSSRCDYRIDILIREHGDHKISELMDLHDEIARLVP